MAKISIVVAAAENGVIGKNNTLPWRLPNDLKYFKKITMGHPIVMGRLTFDSIGKPLPGRTNVVVTRQEDWSADGVVVAHDLAAAIEYAESSKQGVETGHVMIIGGAQLYAQSLSICDSMYLTEVHAEVDGDAQFPAFDRNMWREISREKNDACEKNPYPYSFVCLQRAQ